MNLEQSFYKWFSPKKPNGYKNWDKRLDEIRENYITSFGSNLFDIDIDNIEEEIRKINNNMEIRFDVENKTFAEFNKRAGNGIPQAIIKTWFISYLRNFRDEEDISNDTVNNDDKQKGMSFTYEKDLQNSLVSQAEDLFSDYKIYDNDGESGVQYIIGGKRIDLLLEHKENRQLLAIELKAGLADFKVFGQISMYLGLLTEKFPNRKIKGIIIASEIDESLIKASLTNKEQVKLIEYKMKLDLKDIV